MGVRMYSTNTSKKRLLSYTMRNVGIMCVHAESCLLDTLGDEHGILHAERNKFRGWSYPLVSFVQRILKMKLI